MLASLHVLSPARNGESHSVRCDSFARWPVGSTALSCAAAAWHVQLLWCIIHPARQTGSPCMVSFLRPAGREMLLLTTGAVIRGYVLVERGYVSDWARL